MIFVCNSVNETNGLLYDTICDIALGIVIPVTGHIFIDGTIESEFLSVASRSLIIKGTLIVVQPLLLCYFHLLPFST